jgi:hypothetical protein
LRILISNKLSDGGVEILKDGGNLAHVKTGLKPTGLMGIIGMALNEAGNNIARLFLGRDRQEGTTINIIKVDAEVPKKVIEKIRKVGNARSVQKVFI